MACVDDTIDTFRPCLDEQQESDMNTTREAMDDGIDFICHENGDRIACK